VCDADLESIAVLVDNSLLAARDVQVEPRFTMLETIRTAALEELEASGKADAVRRRLTDYHVGLAARGEAELPGENQSEWLTRLETEMDNLRSTLAWAVEHDPEAALRIAAPLRLFWYLHGYSAEGRRWIEAALAAADTVEASIRAKALTTLGTLAEHQGDFGHARALQEEAVSLLRELDDPTALATVLNNLGVVAVQQGDYDTARTSFEESTEIKRRLGNLRAIAPSLSNLATVAMKQGDIAGARSLHQEAIDLMRELGIASGVVMANSLSTLAEVELADGKNAEARALVDEALDVRRRLVTRVGSPIRSSFSPGSRQRKADTRSPRKPCTRASRSPMSSATRRASRRRWRCAPTWSSDTTLPAQWLFEPRPTDCGRRSARRCPHSTAGGRTARSTLLARLSVPRSSGTPSRAGRRCRSHERCGSLGSRRRSSIRVETVRSPAQILAEAKTIALVGASPKPDRPSHGVMRYLLGHGYQVIPVRPRDCDEVHGVPCASSLLEIEEPIDLVDVFRRVDACPGVAREAAEAGAGAVWLQLGLVSPEARAIAEEAGMDYVEDECTAIVHRRCLSLRS
jgi:predicted CoA-binding protein/tetratricopeptide (TPR) repeat protein